MTKTLKQTGGNQLRKICLSLRHADGGRSVELRVCRPSSQPGEACVPLGEGIVVPSDFLLELHRLLGQILGQTEDRSITEGRSHRPSPPSAITMGSSHPSSAPSVIAMQRGEPVGLDLNIPLSRRGEFRRTVRVPLSVQVACRLVSESCSPKPLIGAIKNISTGGLQLWLSERLPLYSSVELFARIAGANFRGQAEVVRAELEPRNGRYEHGLRWLDLTPPAQDALAKVIRAVEPDRT
ncbi:MAG: PilZ domain-containing protein [Candidatus Methylomirabilales bacterium]